MQDLFTGLRTPKFGGAFAMDEATLTFASNSLNGAPGGGLGLLVQGMNAQYGRPVQRMYELGPNKYTYYVLGRAEGRMQISRLAAPQPVNANFVRTFSNVCNVEKNQLEIMARSALACKDGKIVGSLSNTINPGDATPAISDQDNGLLGGSQGTASKYSFGYCLVDNIQFSISISAIAMTENVSLVFASMGSEDTTNGQ